jgi:hypothetical protein
MLSIEEYINEEIKKPYFCNDLNIVIEKFKNNEKIIITKFGDGEYLNMTLKHIDETNCDGDPYTYEFGIRLRESFLNLIERSDNENIYLGRWHTIEVYCFYYMLYYDYVIKNNKQIKQIPFTHYHFIYPDNEFDLNDNKLFEFVKMINTSTKYKIIMSNNTNKKLQIIFNGNFYIEIPKSSWCKNGLYNQIKDKIVELLNINNDAIVIMAGGMGSKVLIAEISLLYPKVSFIDIGSGFDILASKNDSRGWYKYNNKNNYENQYKYFKSLLPDNYNEL